MACTPLDIAVFVVMLLSGSLLIAGMATNSMDVVNVQVIHPSLHVRISYGLFSSGHCEYLPGLQLLPGDTMMTSSNGNIFRVTGPLCGEFTGPHKDQ